MDGLIDLKQHSFELTGWCLHFTAKFGVNTPPSNALNMIWWTSEEVCIIV